MRIVILQSGVHQSCVIGAISTSLSDCELKGLWDQWRDEVPEPDADSEFVEWVVKNNPNCSAVPFDRFDVVTLSE